MWSRSSALPRQAQWPPNTPLVIVLALLALLALVLAPSPPSALAQQQQGLTPEEEAAFPITTLVRPGTRAFNQLVQLPSSSTITFENGTSPLMTTRLRDALLRLHAALSTHCNNGIHVISAYRAPPLDSLPADRSLQYEGRAAEISLQSPATMACTYDRVENELRDVCYFDRPCTIQQGNRFECEVGEVLHPTRCECIKECPSGQSCECGSMIPSDVCQLESFATRDCRCVQEHVLDSFSASQMTAPFEQLVDMARAEGFNWAALTSPSTIRVSVIPDECESDLDVVFLIDASNSISDDDWFRTKFFVADMASFFRVNGTSTRFNTQLAALSFSSTADVIVDLGESNSTLSFQCAIRNADRDPRETFTGGALQFIRESIFARGSSMSSPGNPRAIVVITDGESSDHSVLVSESQMLNSMGVVIAAVGIRIMSDSAASARQLAELQELAGGAGDRVFQIESVNAIPDIASVLVQELCTTIRPIECCGGDNGQNVPQLFNLGPGRVSYFAPSCSVGDHDLVLTFNVTEGSAIVYFADQDVSMTPTPFTATSQYNIGLGLTAISLPGPRLQRTYFSLFADDDAGCFGTVSVALDISSFVSPFSVEPLSPTNNVVVPNGFSTASFAIADILSSTAFQPRFASKTDTFSVNEATGVVSGQFAAHAMESQAYFNISFVDQNVQCVVGSLSLFTPVDTTTTTTTTTITTTTTTATTTIVTTTTASTTQSFTSTSFSQPDQMIVSTTTSTAVSTTTTTNATTVAAIIFASRRGSTLWPLVFLVLLVIPLAFLLYKRRANNKTDPFLGTDSFECATYVNPLHSQNISSEIPQQPKLVVPAQEPQPSLAPALNAPPALSSRMSNPSSSDAVAPEFFPSTAAQLSAPSQTAPENLPAMLIVDLPDALNAPAEASVDPLFNPSQLSGAQIPEFHPALAPEPAPLLKPHIMAIRLEAEVVHLEVNAVGPNFAVVVPNSLYNESNYIRHCLNGTPHLYATIPEESQPPPVLMPTIPDLVRYFASPVIRDGFSCSLVHGSKYTTALSLRSPWRSSVSKRDALFLNASSLASLGGVDSPYEDWFLSLVEEALYEELVSAFIAEEANAAFLKQYHTAVNKSCSETTLTPAIDDISWHVLEQMIEIAIDDMALESEQFAANGSGPSTAALFKAPTPTEDNDLSEVALTNDLKYDDYFGFGDPLHVIANKRRVLEGLQRAEIPIDEIAHIKFTNGSIQTTIAAPARVCSMITSAAEAGAISFTFLNAGGVGPRSTTPWSTQMEAFYDWYKPNLRRNEVNKILFKCGLGEFIIYQRDGHDGHYADLVPPPSSPPPMRTLKPAPPPPPLQAEAVVQQQPLVKRKVSRPTVHRVALAARVVRRGQKLGAFVDDAQLDVDVDSGTRIVTGVNPELSGLKRKKSYGQRLFPSLTSFDETNGGDDEADGADGVPPCDAEGMAQSTPKNYNSNSSSNNNSNPTSGNGASKAHGRQQGLALGMELTKLRRQETMPEEDNSSALPAPSSSSLESKMSKGYTFVSLDKLSGFDANAGTVVSMHDAREETASTPGARRPTLSLQRANIFESVEAPSWMHTGLDRANAAIMLEQARSDLLGAREERDGGLSPMRSGTLFLVREASKQAGPKGSIVVSALIPPSNISGKADGGRDGPAHAQEEEVPPGVFANYLVKLNGDRYELNGNGIMAASPHELVSTLVSEGNETIPHTLDTIVLPDGSSVPASSIIVTTSALA